jgi:hypothetical protein
MEGNPFAEEVDTSIALRVRVKDALSVLAVIKRAAGRDDELWPSATPQNVAVSISNKARCKR